jgi:hypothetical protein
MFKNLLPSQLLCKFNMDTSECIIYLPAFLDKQFSCTFQSANLAFSELSNNFKKFQVLSSTLQNTQFPNTGKQRNKFTTLIINLCLGWDINAGLWISALYECYVVGDLCNIVGGSTEGVSF